MTATEIIGTIVGFGSFVSFIFGLGTVYMKLKNKPSYDAVDDMIVKRVSEHKTACNFYDKNDGGKVEQCLEDLKQSVDNSAKKIDKLYDMMIK